MFHPLMKRDQQDLPEEPVNLKRINTIDVDINKSLIGIGYHPNFTVLPRVKGAKYTPPQRKETTQKVAWSLKNSLFKDY